jgi:activator of HSP90 ATPase
MTSPIRQSVVLKAPPKTLFDAFLDSGKHSAFTGDKARVSRRVGARFTAFGGMLSGRNLYIDPGRMIVQAWRSVQFKRGDPDSILILTFNKVKGGTRIDVVHVNVPDHDHKGVTKGWPKYYWRPWRAYLAGRKD